MSAKLSSTLRDELRAHALRTLYRPRAASLILESKEKELYPLIRDTIGADTPVLFLEFGVAHGGSLRQMADLFIHPASRFIGFDSFVGLPEAWLMHDRGAFSNLGMPPLIEDSRVSFVQGWFQNSVPPFIDNLRLMKMHGNNAETATLIHFDADLYSSTLFILTNTWAIFAEYWFIFDDFIHDEMVALYDFTSTFPVELEF
jgi:hypothetical protein